MLTQSDVKAELNKIHQAAAGKDKVDPSPMMSQLWNRIIDDFGKHGDQRVRGIIRLMQANKI